VLVAEENEMNLSPICEMKMHYTWIDFVDYGAGGQ